MIYQSYSQTLSYIFWHFYRIISVSGLSSVNQTSSSWEYVLDFGRFGAQVKMSIFLIHKAFFPSVPHCNISSISKVYSKVALCCCWSLLLLLMWQCVVFCDMSIMTSWHVTHVITLSQGVSLSDHMCDDVFTLGIFEVTISSSQVWPGIIPGITWYNVPWQEEGTIFVSASLTGFLAADKMMRNCLSGYKNPNYPG